MLAYVRKIGKNCILGIAASLTLLTMTTNVFAEETADIGEVIVKDSYEQTSSKAPSSFTTIIKPSKYEAESKTTTELVSKTPGVQSKDLGGPGQYSTVTIRGSSAEQVTVLIDGVKINTPEGGGVDFSSIPADIIERIEIVRGGGTAAFGPDAIGGAINIITKKAKKGRSIEIKQTGGSFYTYKSSESWMERREGFGLVLSHTHAQSRGDYKFKSASINLAGTAMGGGQTFTRLNNGFLSEDLLTKFDFLLVPDFKFNFSNNFFFTKRDIAGIEEETTQLYPTNPLEAEEKIFKNISNLSIKADGFFDNRLSLETGVSNNVNRDKFTDPSPAIGAAIDTTTTSGSINPYLVLEPSFQNSKAANLMTLRYDFRTDIMRNTINKNRYSHGILFQDQAIFWNDRLSLIPAIRYENPSDFGDDISLRLGAALKPWSIVTFKGNVETSFRYPNFSELYYPDQGYLRGNANLNKEDAVNYDVGIIVEHKAARAELIYFRNDIKNQIIWVPISATTIQPINTYDVKANGVETSLSIRPVSFLDIESNYTWLTARFKSNDFQLPGRPRHKWNSRIGIHRDFTKKFGGNLFGEHEYTSSLPVNTQNTVFIAQRSSFNAGATARFLANSWGAYTLTFEAKDITNMQIYDARGFPLPRRSFFVTLGMKWS
ncbi:MAG: hypothetical protein A3I09_00535 [Deltaproteobacteria bacterium RIFCSPLOWO2_02_FULL_47_10]|nr:MAG: hypothetical protein A3I09_00535 [Deltaproteobacteria bacterium RIFCSPLOWO2_02_FULL_47_10]